MLHPIFEELAAWLKEQLTKILTARSPIGKALSYLAQREKELGLYWHDGMVEIDTNIIENTIRPIALGRKNYLFAGSHEAAQNAAIIYSLFATCKLHNVNLYYWLKHVLTVMPTFPSGNCFRRTGRLNQITSIVTIKWKNDCTCAEWELNASAETKQYY